MRQTHLIRAMFSGHFEFTWQQFMVGVQSSLIMFPINILIVSVFRNTCPRVSSCCQRKTKKASRRQQKSSIQTTSLKPGTTTSSTGSCTLDTIIKVSALCLCEQQRKSITDLEHCIFFNHFVLLQTTSLCVFHSDFM